MEKIIRILLMAGILGIGATSSDSALRHHGFGSLQPAGVNMQSGQVPEPATMFLFGAGLIGISFIARRKPH